jgi:hypothetical protein
VLDEGRRVVVAVGFDAVVCETSRAIEEEGLRMIARIDDVWRDIQRSVVFETWSPELWCEALRHNLDPDALVVTTFTIYEVADGETAVVATEPFSQNPEWLRKDQVLSAFAHRERERVARVLERLQHPRPYECHNTS